MSFKACVYLLIFCLDDLSIDVSGVLKSPTVIVLPSISPFMAVGICLMLLCWAHVYNCYIFFLDWSLDHYVVSFLASYSSLYFKKSNLSGMSIATPAFFWLTFACYTFLHPLSFSLYVSIDLNWVSCRQHIYGSCFCIQPASLCVLFGTFKVVTNMYVLIAILLIILDLFL